MFEFLVNREEVSQRVCVNEQIIRIGRDDDCEISLPQEEEMEKFHIKIVVTENQGCLLLPQSSETGGLLNGKAIQNKNLEVGDVLTIGKTHIVFLGVLEEGDEEEETGKASKTAPVAQGEEKGGASLQKGSEERESSGLSKTEREEKEPESKEITQEPAKEALSQGQKESLPGPFATVETEPQLSQKSQKKKKPSLASLEKKNRILVALLLVSFSFFLLSFSALIYILYFNPLNPPQIVIRGSETGKSDRSSPEKGKIEKISKGNSLKTSGEKEKETEKKQKKEKESSTKSKSKSKEDNTSQKSRWSQQEILTKIEKLGDSDPRLRIEATRHLKENWKKGGSLLPTLLEKASENHKDPVVRWRARWILETKRNPQAPDPLVARGLISPK